MTRELYERDFKRLLSVYYIPYIEGKIIRVVFINVTEPKTIVLKLFVCFSVRAQ